MAKIIDLEDLRVTHHERALERYLQELPEETPSTPTVRWTIAFHKNQAFAARQLQLFQARDAKRPHWTQRQRDRLERYREWSQTEWAPNYKRRWKKLWSAKEVDHIPKGREVLLRQLYSSKEDREAQEKVRESLGLEPLQDRLRGRILCRERDGTYRVDLGELSPGVVHHAVVSREKLLYPIPKNLRLFDR